MKYAIAVVAFCALLSCIGVLVSSINDDAKEQEGKTEIEVTKWKTRYKRLLKTKRVMVPMPVYNVTDCEAELETCTGALSAIKLWCDPECKQQLSECLDALRIAQECNVSYYSYRRPM